MTSSTGVISEKLCSGCGADVRDASEFCYACGEKVGDNVLEIAPPASSDASERPVENRRPANTADSENSSDPKVGDLKTVVGPGGKTRRYPKGPLRRERKPVEVIWRKKEGPGFGFLILSLAFALIVAAMIGIAFYLK